MSIGEPARNEKKKQLYLSQYEFLLTHIFQSLYKPKHSCVLKGPLLQTYK